MRSTGILMESVTRAILILSSKECGPCVFVKDGNRLNCVKSAKNC